MDIEEEELEYDSPPFGVEDEVDQAYTPKALNPNFCCSSHMFMT